MKRFKVIITLLLVFSMAFCIIVPVGASDYTSQISTFWEQWCLNLNFAYPFLGDLPGILCSEVCTSSSDGLHHCTCLDDATLANTGHDDKGWYCNCTCAYCGKTFKAYSSDFEHSYNDYLTSLPCGGFGRDGVNSPGYYYSPFVSSGSYNFDGKSFTWSCESPCFVFALHTAITSQYEWQVLVVSLVSGARFHISSYDGVLVLSNSLNSSQNISYCRLNYIGSASPLDNPGCSLPFFDGVLGDFIFPLSYDNLSAKVSIVDSSVVSTYYPTSSRVNTTINNYAIQNDGDTYTYITNKPIFDEDTLVFFNPLTGVSFNVTGWYYDYSTRRYVLTYKDDNSTTQTTTVEYGDENIKVTTGDTTNNYYYTVPDTSCQHTYVISNSLAPTCTAPGSKTYTCSKCNDTYSETVPALGHNWVKGDTVPTTYESDGTTVKMKGYTLYTCSRCGEKYYDYDGTGPPASSEEDTPTLNWLQRIYYKLVDILNAVFGIDTSVTVDTASGTDIKVTVPGVDGTEDKQFSLKDFKAKFGWLHEIHTIISTFVSDITSDSQNAYAMSATSFTVSDDGSQGVAAAAESPTGSTSAAPSIVIDFSKAKSVYGYNYGGQTEVLDLSWYAEYKPTVDAILSGFLWLLFLWGVFKHAPGIIGGGDLMDNQIDKFKGGHKS